MTGIRTVLRAAHGSVVILLLAGVALAASMARAEAAPTTAASSGSTWPAHYAAPYVDISLYPKFDLVGAAQASGTKFFTLAFVLNGGSDCNAVWSSYDAIDSGFLNSDIDALRAMGGDVAISIGGANGSEPAASCTSAEALQAQYQRVVGAYGLTHLDFDVEGAAIADAATVDRRNTAIAGLEAANPNLHVSYTLPVLPSGLTEDGVNLLSNATADGARVDVVNVMAMDYGSANSDMGGAATSAATALVDQLRGVWPDRTDAQLWAMVGITPMIGQNDSQGEIFTADNAAAVLSFARSHGVSELALWSAGRDNGGCAGQTYASPTCSGLSQDQWAFTKQFGAFTGS